MSADEAQESVNAALVARFHSALWSDDEAALAACLAPDAQGVYADPGRNWSGREAGVRMMLRQAQSLKRMPGAELTIVLVADSPTVLSVRETYTYSGKSTSAEAEYGVKDGLIVLFDYSKSSRTS